LFFVKDAIINATKGDGNKIKELNRQWEKFNNYYTTTYTLNFFLSGGQGNGLGDEVVNKIFGSFVNYTKTQDSKSDSSKANKVKADTAREEFKKKKEEITAQNNNIKNSIGGSQYLKNLESYFYDKKPYSELGTIGKIYINIQFLYGLSLDNNLESQDKKEKQDISLYDFIKNILSHVSNSIGNVNNFDIHVDPIDNIARIIDINYVDSDTRDTAYNNAFTLEMHNLKSTARSYKLESQIFPEQSTIIAVGSQVKGSALGTGADTMVDFNKNISDRIVPAKIDPNISDNETQSEQEQLTNLKESLRTIYSFLGNTINFYNFTSIANFDSNNASTYKNALRDLIAYFKSISNSDSKNRAIIPTKLSVELDGIGGLIIGHIFKIPKELLPKGYQGGALGSKQGYIITGLGHKVSNSDWTTEIGAQTIILDKPIGADVNYQLALETAIAVIQNPAALSSNEPVIIRTGKNSGLDGRASISSKYGNIAAVLTENGGGLNDFYGKTGIVKSPFPLYSDPSRKNRVKQAGTDSFTCNALVKDQLQAIFNEIKTTFTAQQIQENKYDIYSGCLNPRLKRGSKTAASVHSWGIAVDINQGENQLKQSSTSKPPAQFSDPKHKKYIDIWYKHGFKSLGREQNRDWMHFQINDVAF
jgi:hypothetical protein